MTTRQDTVNDQTHALAALTGLAIGDALGMPTQSMSLAQIRADHGTISGFVDAGPHQRIAAGMPAGTITDDTEQAVMVAELLVEGDGHIDPTRFAEALIAWERAMQAKGSLDLLGPSTKTAVQRILDGVPASEAGSTGTTNGAAMRIAPVGIAVPSGDLVRLVDAVQDASRVTHDTGIGIAGASAVAAAVSAGVGGASRTEALDAAVAAATIGAAAATGSRARTSLRGRPGRAASCRPSPPTTGSTPCRSSSARASPARSRSSQRSPSWRSTSTPGRRSARPRRSAATRTPSPRWPVPCSVPCTVRTPGPSTRSPP